MSENKNNLMPPALAELFARVDGLGHAPSLEYLAEALQETDVEFAELEKFALFNTNTYRRNLIHHGGFYHALLLCWRHGQRSPIHDHQGSACAVKVLKGEALETVFARISNSESSNSGSGHIYATHSRTATQGEVCASEDADIHQMSNLSAIGGDLVTLHIYSPPLEKMNIYSLTSSERQQFIDPVYSFSDGAGI